MRSNTPGNLTVFNVPSCSVVFCFCFSAIHNEDCSEVFDTFSLSFGKPYFFFVYLQTSSSESKRAIPPQVAEKGLEIAEKALDKQLEIAEEQQKKVDEFVSKEVSVARAFMQPSGFSISCNTLNFKPRTFRARLLKL